MNGFPRRDGIPVPLLVLSLLLAACAATAQDVVEIGQWVNGPCRVLVADGDRLYAGNGRALEVLAVDQAGGAASLGRLVLDDVVRGIAVAGGLAVVACGEAGAYVVSVGDPAAPRLLGTYDTGGEARAAATDGSWAYVADFDTGLHVIDVSDPAAPENAATLRTDGGLSALALAAEKLYVGDVDGDLDLFDVIDPRHPFLVDHHGDSGDVYGIAVAGGRAYLAQGAEGLLVLDVSDPQNIDDLGRLSLGGAWAFGVAVDGDRAHVAAAASGLKVVDVSDPSAMTITAELELGGYAYDVAPAPLGVAVADSWPGVRLVDLRNETAPVLTATILSRAHAARVSYAEPYAVIADADSSLRVLEILEGGAPREIGSVSLPEVRDVAAAPNLAVAACNRFGLHVIDLTDPTRPELAAVHDTPGLAGGVCLHEGVAWTADGDGGLFGVEVVDPASPPRTFSLAVGTDICDVAALEGLLALGDADGAVHLVDVSDPAAPSLLGTAAVTGTVRRVAFGPGVVLAACGFDGLRVVDATEPTAPFEAGSAAATQQAWDVASLVGYALTADDGAGVHVYDVSDPTDPFTVLLHDTGRALGLDVLRKRILVADGDDGLRVLFSRLVVPTVVADLRAERDGADVVLAWTQHGDDAVEVRRTDGAGRRTLLGSTSAAGWRDADAPRGAVTYRLSFEDGRTVAEASIAAAQLALRLDHVVFDPDEDGAVIRFATPAASGVRLDVCDLRGRRVARVAEGAFAAGEHELLWDGRDARGGSVASGVYLVRLRVGDSRLHRRLSVLR